TQRELAERVGVSQQAVAQAERWRSNPTIELMRGWAAACGARLKVDVRVPRRKPVMRHSSRRPR
ncbi:MAG: helix-turn-helix transcriptional regulator, partial [Thermoanaerobaculia bacterium]